MAAWWLLHCTGLEPCRWPTGMWACGAGIVRSEGALALYKGLVPALAGIAPYAAINFASYDGLKAWAYGAGSAPCAAHSAVPFAEQASLSLWSMGTRTKFARLGPG